MEISGHIHDPVAVMPGTEPQLPIGEAAAWAPTGIHRHLEKITMETLHEGHPEERSGKCITNTGFLSLNKTQHTSVS